ncbi:MAG: methyl-accepting chemotaxis protein [PVC group bacterium]|nr:methyl-accepting chemotaxis protein [PVC group bacterium]
MAKKNNSFIRRNYFVLKGFQVRFSIIIFIATLVISLIAVWTTYVVTWNEINIHVESQNFAEKLRVHYSQGQGIGENIELVNAIFAVEFSDVFDRVSKSLMIRLLASSLVLFVLSIFASHKMAGPIYRMANVAKAIREGNLTVDLSRLREGDEFTELADELNGAIIKLRSSVNRCKQMAGKLSTMSGKLVVHSKENKGIPDKAAKTIKEMEDIANKLVAEIDYFKTKKG